MTDIEPGYKVGKQPSHGRGYCEHIDWDSPVKTHWNTISNASFGLAALWLMIQNTISRCAAKPVGMVALLAVGIGSGIAHATLTYQGFTLDVAAMGLAAAGIVGVSTCIVSGRRAGMVLGGMTALLLILAASAKREGRVLNKYAFTADQGYTGVGFVLAFIALAVVAWKRDKVRSFSYIVLGGLIATFVRLLDQNPAFCMPHSALQWHSLWHLLAAALMAWAFKWLGEMWTGN